jgi:hypothetical protein
MKHVLDFGPISEATLKQLAERLSISGDEAILRSIAFLATVTEKVERGETLMLKSKDGSLHDFAA